MNLMDEQDKKNISANNPDEPKDALGFEAALVGYEKNVLLFRERGRDNSCNDLLEEQNCDIVDWYKQAIVKYSYLKHEEDCEERFRIFLLNKSLNVSSANNIIMIYTSRYDFKRNSMHNYGNMVIMVITIC